MKKIIYLLLFLFLCLPPPLLAAVGDAITCGTIPSVSAAATTDIRPGSGAEWVVHTIFFQYDIELQRYDGTSTLPMGPYAPVSPTGDFISGNWHLTNTNYLRVKNLHGSVAKFICFDGVVTK